VFFAECALAGAKDSIRGKRCLVSGSGNVAQFCALKLVESGALVLAMSDSHGTVYEPEGFSREQVHQARRGAGAAV
jgi:glutamate dehydrogenase (NADP+)